MILKPFTDGPYEGVLAYTDNILVRFESATTFKVYNGRWVGTNCGDTLLVHVTNKSHAIVPFQQVMELTTEERQQYYMTDPIVLPTKEEINNGVPF